MKNLGTFLGHWLINVYGYHSRIRASVKQKIASNLLWADLRHMEVGGLSRFTCTIGYPCEWFKHKVTIPDFAPSHG